MGRFDTDFDRRLADAWHLFRDGDEVPERSVPGTIQRSWSRSRDYGLSEGARIVFDPVPRSRLKAIPERYHDLLEHVQPEMRRLFDTLDPTAWILAFIEAEGSVIASLGGMAPSLSDVATALRPGVILSEEIAGTSGPGCALAERRPAIVSGSEHYLEAIRRFACAAVPVMAPCGTVTGVLNGSRCHDGRPLGIVEPLLLAARAIENRMVLALPEATIVRIHGQRELVASAHAGVLAVTDDGRIVGASSYARQLLGMRATGTGLLSDLLDTPHDHLIDRLQANDDQPARLWRHNRVAIHAQLARRAHAATPPARQHRARTSDGGGPLFGSQANRAIERAERVYARGLPILISGETGTGKEVLARHLHDSGPRRHGPFIAINCSAIPADLIESELFGYAPGAFTGAHRQGKLGLFEQANGGTLFLDEIGDMPLGLQCRLLRVIQERRVTRLGGHREHPLDCALLAATHHDLRRAVAEGRFREDLYYRINGLGVALTPLREREDIDALIDAIVRRLNRVQGPLSLDEATRRLLRQHCWPGNVRELEHVLRLGAALSTDGVIRPGDISVEPPVEPQHPTLPAPAQTLERAEQEAIAQALERHGGNVSAAARELGIARATIYRKLAPQGLTQYRAGTEATERIDMADGA